MSENEKYDPFHGLNPDFEKLAQIDNVESIDQARPRPRRDGPPTLGEPEKRETDIAYAFDDLVFRDMVAPRYLIKGFLFEDTLVEFFGDPSAGKSLIALDMALHIANGFPWHGHKTVKSQVFYIAAEGQFGVKCRAKVWCDTTGGTPENFKILNVGVPLTNCLHAKAVNEAIAKHWDRESPIFIAIDTLARNFGGGRNESATEDMNLFIANVEDYLRRPFRACAAVVHHCGHGEKTRSRGNSALRGAIDIDYCMSKSPGGVVVMKCTKMKDSPYPPEKAFAIQSIDTGILDQDGDPVTAPLLCLTAVPEKPKAETTAIKDTRLLDKIFDELAKDGPVLMAHVRQRFNDEMEGLGLVKDAPRKRWSRAMPSAKFEDKNCIATLKV